MPTLGFESHDAFFYHYKVWTLFGIYRPETRNARQIHLLTPFMLIVVGILGALISFGVNLVKSDNLATICESFTPTFTAVFCFGKLLYFFTIRKRLLTVKPILDKLDGRAADAEQRSLIRRGIRIARKTYEFYLLLIVGILGSGLLVISLSSERKLPFLSWYPGNWRTNWAEYVLVVCHQSFGVFSISLSNSAIDTYSPALMAIVSAHIDALSIRIRNIGRNCSDSREDRYRLLTECIKDHVVILQLFGRIQELVSFTCFIQFFLTGAAQSSIAIYFLYTDFEVANMMHATSTFIGLTGETLFLCYFGDILQQHAAMLATEIYFSNWVEQDTKYRKALLVFMQRAQHTKQIMAGYLIPVDLKTFLVAFKTSYSLFAVLNNVK